MFPRKGEKYADSHGFTNTRVLIDDGYTGTNFNRPGIQEALSLVEQGLVSTFIVKDMSRFGRDYLQVGQYTELIVNEYIQKIVVHAPDKSSGKRKQRIQIYFNFLGEFNIHNLNAPIILEMPPISDILHKNFARVYTYEEDSSLSLLRYHLVRIVASIF